MTTDRERAALIYRLLQAAGSDGLLRREIEGWTGFSAGEVLLAVLFLRRQRIAVSIVLWPSALSLSWDWRARFVLDRRYR